MSERCYPLDVDATLLIPRYVYEDGGGKVAKTNLTHITWEDTVTEVNLAIPLQKRIAFNHQTFHGDDHPFTLTIRPRLNCMEQVRNFLGVLFIHILESPSLSCFLS